LKESGAVELISVRNHHQQYGASKQEFVLNSQGFFDRTYYIKRIGSVRNAAKGPPLSMYMVDHVKPDPKFELIDSDGLFSGLRHLRYGTGRDDPIPFILTLTPQYVAREIRKTLPVSYIKVQRYAQRNADKLKAIAKFGKKRGLNAHTLQ